MVETPVGSKRDCIPPNKHWVYLTGWLLKIFHAVR